MAVGALGSSASATQVNFQAKADPASQQQAVQGAKKSAKSAQTDTVTISAQALKIADEKSAVAREEAKKADDQRTLQLASEKVAVAKRTTQSSQSNAVRAYAAVSAAR